MAVTYILRGHTDSGGGQWLGGLLDAHISSRNDRTRLPVRERERVAAADWSRFEAVSGRHDGGQYKSDDERGGFDPCICSRVNLLESFYYVADWQTRNIHNFKSFMLDSGAFTFMQHAEKTVDWDEYLNKYIQYINANDISLFFELDIDSVVGYERVLVMRDRLERETGRRCIPVWHVNRGWDEWLKMCDGYDYVAVGGIATRQGRAKLAPYLPKFTAEAHKHNTRVHGLGYTDLKNLARSGFDSVDSTAWLTGNLSGSVYRWDGRRMTLTRAPAGKKLNSNAAARHNFMQWVEMGEYLEGTQ